MHGSTYQEVREAIRELLRPPGREERHVGGMGGQGPLRQLNMERGSRLTRNDEPGPEGRKAVVEDAAGHPHVPHQVPVQHLGGTGVCKVQAPLSNRDELDVDRVWTAVLLWIEEVPLDVHGPDAFQQSRDRIRRPLQDARRRAQSADRTGIQKRAVSRTHGLKITVEERNALFTSRLKKILRRFMRTCS